MWATLAGFFKDNAVKIFGWATAALSVAGVLLGARQAGKDALRAVEAEQTLELKNAQQKAAAAAPHSRDDIVGELQDGKF